MKRILCFIDTLGAGGAQRQMVYLAEILKERGYEVKVVTYVNRSFYQADLNKAHIPYENLDNAGNRFFRIFYVWKTIRDFRPDCVIAYLDTPCMLSCAIKLLTRGRWRLLVSERNTTQKLTFKERIKFWLYRAADQIVPNSYAQTDFIKNHFPRLSYKTNPIINLVALDKFRPAESVNKSDGAIRVVVVASIISSKNTKGFIRAVRSVKDACQKPFTIDWFGIATGDYCRECLEMVKFYGLEDVLRLLPKTVNIESEYRRANWFCLPSFYEGTPNVICEAIASGLPIICSNVCDNMHYVRSGQNGYLFDPTSEDNMANVLMTALNTSWQERCKMGEYSRRLAENCFSRKRFGDQYCSAIENQPNS